MQFVALSPTAVIPKRATPLSAGFDLASSKDMDIPAGVVTCIPTGIAVSLPEDYYGRIALRSGWSVRNSAVCTAGVIDRDYMGEIKVAVLVMTPTKISAGERFAQLVVEKCYMGAAQTPWKFEDHPGNTIYHAGWGSTGQ